MQHNRFNWMTLETSLGSGMTNRNNSHTCDNNVVTSADLILKMGTEIQKSLSLYSFAQFLN